MVDPRSDTPGINQPSVGIVISEQERPEPPTCALRISPANHYELLAVLTLDLDPQAAIAGRIRRVAALGDDSLQRHFADLGVELRAPSDLVIAELQQRACIRQQLPEPFLSLA